MLSQFLKSKWHKAVGDFIIFILNQSDHDNNWYGVERQQNHCQNARSAIESVIKLEAFLDLKKKLEAFCMTGFHIKVIAFNGEAFAKCH